jgi:LuxR family maltose regulon positive regulatory protein
MASPLLATKFHVPRRRRGAVPRPRLVERLDRAIEGRLTLVSAPAGFGKTTVLTEWLAARELPAAWLSLDPRDNDPVVFWTYLLSALQTATRGRGAEALALLAEGRTPIDQVLDTLVNELDAVEGDVVLVLDDYHAVEAPEIHERTAYLLEHLPPQLHVVLATRADPALPLARLRARGELVELRADDLRFTGVETATYLADAVGRPLAAGQVAALEDRTEGWIAALQLAALSMQGRDDVADFIAGFAGDDRFVVDYLAEEVLQRQPDDVRTFLLQTSVLSRLNGPLCDAVVGRDGGRTMLEALDRANLFLVPLDDRRHWYRYHHLFADVLHARLLDELPDRVPDLHRRASRWYEQHGEPAEAIRHALAGGDVEHAADLVESAMAGLQQNRQETTLRRWLEALGDEVLRDRPALGVTYAGTLVQHGEFDGVEARLRDAERRLDAAPTPDAPEVRRVAGQVALYRAALATMAGDLAATIGFAQRALDLVEDDDHLVRGSVAGLLGLAHWAQGELGTAYRWWADSHTDLDRAGHASDLRGVALALADIRIAQGRLRDAMTIYDEHLRDGTAPVLRGTADMHVGMAEVLRERNDLAGARQHLAAATELGERAGLPQNPYRWRVAMARVLEAEGDLDGAVELLDEAERCYVGDMFPEVRPIDALRARIALVQGRVDDALDWARRRGLSADDDLGYLAEFSHVTLARILLAQAAVDGRFPGEALRLLDRLLRAAEAGERTGVVVELLVLQAVAHQALGRFAPALAWLERALTLAEPEGYVRVFLDEGPSMTALLAALARQGAPRTYVRRLLAARAADDVAPVRQALIEPLSTRELEILRLLGSDLDGPGIARQLVVSDNTVRTHTKIINPKLRVNSRRAAVRRAAELDLLPRGR